MSSTFSLGVSSDEARRSVLSPKGLPHCWVTVFGGGGWSSSAFSPQSSECCCKYVVVESTCWYCVHSKCVWGFWKCFGSCESNVTHRRFEPWVQYCKCLTGCNHSASYFVFGNCGQLVFPAQLWPCYAVLCWTVILFGCNSNMFGTHQQNHIHL